MIIGRERGGSYFLREMEYFNEFKTNNLLLAIENVIDFQRVIRITF